ncbi:MAG: fatty acyl-AMP ligase [Xenococcaceae cyanobacterium MO_188.B19]|nr:fatty acyl-AMP ligase [Xenococcaceae cyanobacterium MO_188.B19]
MTITTLVDLLRERAKTQPEKLAYRWLENGKNSNKTLTYSDLEQQAIAIATKLRNLQPKGSRAILIYPYNSGLEFIAGFFGCLYAEMVAVPAHPPQNSSALRDLQQRLVNSEAKIILTTKSLLSKVQKRLSKSIVESSIWLATDNLELNSQKQSWDVEVKPETLAFLQYTSGSTGIPKGVMITHECLMFNQQILKQAFAGDANSVGVGWLPLYHDMGLIGNILHALYLGIPCVLMSPVDFIQKPIKWLEAISRYGGTISGAPNFAYDLLCKKVTPEQKANLNLSSWELAFSGAEPIRKDTFNQFADYFSDCGFSKDAFYPCYGMAEATLFITGGIKTQPPIIKYLDKSALGKKQAKFVDTASEKTISVVSCGKSWLDQTIVIVDPDSLTTCEPYSIGEIWVSSKGVGKGYWNQSELTAKTFEAVLPNSSQKFLRTGDLGFIDEGELYITGRLKDVLMLWGLTHYPHHIEETVEKSYEGIAPNSSAAFSITVNGEEKLAIATEVKRSYRKHINIDDVVETMRWKVFDEHFADIHAIAFLSPGSLPKTSSGKVRRNFCKQQFLAGELNILGQWISVEGDNSNITSTIERYFNPMTHLKRYSGLIRGRLRRVVYTILSR